MQAVWKTHKPDCKAIQVGRAASLNNGANPETLVSIPLTMPSEEVAALFTPMQEIREKYHDTEERLDRGDASLPTRDKVKYYADLLAVLDTTSHENGRSLVHKMALNRRYNGLYRDATTRLKGHELNALNREMQQRRIGAFFKQQP